MVDDFVWMLLHENSIHFNYFVFSCIWTLHYMKFLNFVCFLVEFGISGFTFLSSCICWICWSLILILLDLGQLEFLSVIICCFYLFSIDWKDMVILGSLWGIKEKEGVPFFFFFFSSEMWIYITIRALILMKDLRTLFFVVHFPLNKQFLGQFCEILLVKWPLC